MTDRELLELAAKAAGIELDWFGDGTPAIKEKDENIDPVWAFMDPWNPLTDDGDALRLAVKLGMFMRGIVRDIPDGEFIKDPYAATRRAIVRAAAEIGRTL